MSSSAPKSPVIFLMGPTASGKTALALALGEELPVELISVDATLVYRGMDIGSAKPTAAELARAPHHLIDIRDPADPYSVADFHRDALRAIADIHERGHTPCLVGGTMMYFNALLTGLADLPGADPELRVQLEMEARQKGWPELHRQLAVVDPESATRLHPNHSQRILRALEVYRLTGNTLTALRRRQRSDQRNSFARQYALVQLALVPNNRAFLHERIGRRFDAMLDAGLEQEVRALMERGDLSPALPAVRAVGYRQMWDYLTGRLSRQAMIERGIAATRQLAKRQLTWLRKWPDLNTLYIDTPRGDATNIDEIREQALNYVERITI